MGNSLARAVAIKEYMIRIRRYLHQHPEIGFEERHTSRFIAEELTNLGMKVKAGIAKTGVVGLLEGPNQGKTLAFRGEMDALPIHEDTGLPFSSMNAGVMHACGHDATMSIVLGVAKLLSEDKDLLRGNVKFVFSPSEESLPGGAKMMIEEGVLEMPPVDFMISCHCHHTLSVGTVGYCRGKTLASPDLFRLVISTKGGHCASPDLGADAIAASALVINSLQYIVSRRISPLDSAVISIGTINGGYKENILADRVEMKGTIRTFDPVLREKLPKLMEQNIKSVTDSMEAIYSFELIRGYPPTITDKMMMDLFVSSAEQLIGREHTFEQDPLMAGDDIAYFFEKIPGCWFILGTSNKEKGIEGLIHTSKFDIDEDALPIAAGIMLDMAKSLLTS